MQKRARMLGLVGFSIMTALLVASSSGSGYTWDTKTNWTRDDSVSDDDLDAVHTFYNYNGNAMDVMCVPLSGGTPGAPENVQRVQNKFLIFHSKLDLYCYWGEGIPGLPSGCTKIYCQGALELKLWDGDSWEAVGGSHGSDDAYMERTSAGQDWEEYFLHVFKDNQYPIPGQDYQLFIYIVGGYNDAQGPHTLDSISVYRYYHIVG